MLCAYFLEKIADKSATSFCKSTGNYYFQRVVFDRAMNQTPQLVRLHVRTIRRYRKLVGKLQRGSVTDWQRKTFVAELRRLIQRLRGLHAQLKIAAATGTVILMLNAGQVQAQMPTIGPFVKQDRWNNPLREPILISPNFTTRGDYTPTVHPTLAVVDFDGDGDYDVVQGQSDYEAGGFLRYFENLSDEGKPVYVERLNTENPFDGIRAYSGGVAPAFADIDKDGDLDLFLGQNGWYAENGTGTIRGIEFFRNDGGKFSRQTGAANPFNGVVLGDDVRPVFVDFDKDGDLDALIGSYHWTGNTSEFILYYQNNGAGSFTPVPITVPGLFAYNGLSPAVADLDNDGDYDIILGAYYLERLLYLQQTSPGVFEQKTGAQNPFDSFEVGGNPSPVFIDFNKDGHLDLFLADESYWDKYSNNIINYYKNQGNNSFEQIHDFENPFEGVYVKGYAAPVFLDINGDLDMDLVVGNDYYRYNWDYDLGMGVYTFSTLQYYENTAEGYKKVQDTDHPLHKTAMRGFFSPQFVDVDGDGDLDIISGHEYGDVVFFRNDNGEYVNEMEFSPFAGLNVEYQATAKLVDIDSDGDLDLFMTNGGGQIYFFRKDPNGFTQQFGDDNPLAKAALRTGDITFLDFTDIDHDGDLDLFFGGRNKYQQPGGLLYMENTGTEVQPVFGDAQPELFSGIDPRAPQVTFFDYDTDGDLDAFIGNYNGTISYVRNDNPAVVVGLSSSTTAYAPGDDPVVVAADLTVTDPDNDAIRQALVSIIEYQAGEVLSFTPVAGINGHFDTEIGVLFLTGSATAADYQNALRTVTFGATTDPGGRARATLPKGIQFSVYDADFTNPQPATRIIDVEDGGFTVYNAVAPNSTGDNKFMRISGLPAKNKVSIFNRWGDKVFEAEAYENALNGNSFKGFSTDGKTLPSGTYFYWIEVPGSKRKTGYLTLKQ